MMTNEGVMHGGELAGEVMACDSEADPTISARFAKANLGCRAWLAVVLAVLGVVQSVMLTGIWIEPYGQYQLDSLATRYGWSNEYVFTVQDTGMQIVPVAANK